MKSYGREKKVTGGKVMDKKEKWDIIGRWFAISLMYACFCVAVFLMGLRLGYQVGSDVYRDKTTLEIAYQDSVVVDSVVVYKMK